MQQQVLLSKCLVLTRAGAAVALVFPELLGSGRMKGKKIPVVKVEVWESELLPVAVYQSGGAMLVRSHRSRVNAKAVQSILHAVLGEGYLCQRVQVLGLFCRAKRS